MKDNYISRAAVTCGAFWAIALALVVTTWILAASHAPLRFQGAIALTAVLFMAAAMVGQFRLYTLRLCGLIRVSAGLERPDADLAHLRPRRD